MRQFSSIEQLMFSDLLQKSLDAEFDDTSPENGSFLLQTRRGRQYWYYKGFPQTLREEQESNISNMWIQKAMRSWTNVFNVLSG